MTATKRRTRPFLTLFLCVTALVVSGCSARNCGGNLPYLQVQPPAEFVVPEGITPPPPSGAYRIPEGGRGDIELTREFVDSQGKTRQDCIFDPPRYVPQELAAQG